MCSTLSAAAPLGASLRTLLDRHIPLGLLTSLQLSARPLNLSKRNHMPKRARVNEEADDASTSSRVAVKADFTNHAEDVGPSSNQLWRLPIEVLAWALQYLGEVQPFRLRLVGRRWLAAVAYVLEFPLQTQLRRDGGVFRFLNFAPRLLCQLGGTMHAMSKVVLDTINELTCRIGPA